MDVDERKIYLVIEHMEYEGDAVLSAYDSLEGAEREVERLTEERSAEYLTYEAVEMDLRS